jgi:hypothetical protein
MSRLFVRRGGVIDVRLSVEDKSLLVQLPDLLSSVTTDDPAYEVLNRAGYRNDAEAEVEYRSLIGSQLERDRRDDIMALLRLTGPSASVDDDDARSALRAINGARLALAARANIMDGAQGWESRISEDPVLAAIAWLGYLQGELIAALVE